MNIFMEQIYKKKKFSFKSWRAYNKFIKKLDRESPNFLMLWNICDFIKLSEFAFFYDNSQKADLALSKPDSLGYSLFSSIEYNPGTNGLIFTNKDVKMVFKLFTEKGKDNRIVVEISRLKGNCLKGKLEFVGDGWIEDHSDYDEMLLETSINLLMDAVKDMFIKYYRAKRV